MDMAYLCTKFDSFSLSKHHPEEAEHNKYVRPYDTHTEMCVGSVVCCPLESLIEYALHAILRLEKRWDRQADGWTDVKLLQYAYC